MKLRRKVGEKGQVVIPKDIRDKEGINSDTEVYFWTEEGKIVMEKKERKLSDTLEEIDDGGKAAEKTGSVKERMKRAGIDI